MYQRNYVSSPSPMHAFSSKVEFHNNNNITYMITTIECRNIPAPDIGSKAEEHFSYKGRCGVMRIKERASFGYM